MNKPRNTEKEKGTNRILMSAQFVTKSQIEDIKAASKREGYTKIEFWADSFLGPWLTIDL